MSPCRCIDNHDEETCDEPVVLCQNELDVGIYVMSGVELTENDTHDNSDVTLPCKARKQRRRSSVVAKINKAIHRQKGGDEHKLLLLTD